MSRRDLEGLRTKLLAGARKGGLTAKQCEALAALIDLPPLGRPPDPPTKAAMWAEHCFALEHAGTKLKTAVDMTAKHFDCSCRSVYAARTWILLSK